MDLLMTTTVIVRPNGHNAEVVIHHPAASASMDTVQVLDPHAETSFAVYDDRTITVREIEGWAEKPA
jgi:hypothetical protein